MTFKLSARSLSRLEGVDEQLVETVKRAIEITPVDFGVTCGLRTERQQADLVAAGKSQTMKSKHLTGDAVDLVAWVGGEICWEAQVYEDVASAMREAANEVGIVADLRWGAAWHIPDILEYYGTMEEAAMSYIDLRRSQGRRPFIDAPHFEIG